MPATRPKDRKPAIVAAAAELFAAQGYAAVGIDDIGAAVGVSGPAIYRHFTGKEALLAAVVLDATESIASAVEDGVARIGEAPAEALVGGAVAAALDRPASLAVFLRERERLVGDGAAAVAAIEARVDVAWRHALAKVAPGLDPIGQRMRQAAISGMLATATSNPGGVARPRLDELVSASAAAMMQVRPQPPRWLDAEEAAWSPPAGKRDEILNVALRLFRERGYHGVGIDEIGDAAGISGPTVYHYVASKAELLVDAYDRVGARVQVGVERAIVDAGSPAEALDQLVRSYAAIAMDSVDLIVVTSREGSAIPEEERPRLARRRRAVRDGWVVPLRELRPELAEPEVRLLVRAAFPLVNEACRRAGGDPARVAEVVALTRAHLLTNV
jgi:AcrR family transcriptional regulator